MTVRLKLSCPTWDRRDQPCQEPQLGAEFSPAPKTFLMPVFCSEIIAVDYFLMSNLIRCDPRASLLFGVLSEISHDLHQMKHPAIYLEPLHIQIYSRHEQMIRGR